MFFKKGVLRNFTTFTRKHLCQSLFCNTEHLWGLLQKVVQRSSHWKGFLEIRASKILRNHKIHLEIQIPLKIPWKELLFYNCCNHPKCSFIKLICWDTYIKKHVQIPASMCFLLSFTLFYKNTLYKNTEFQLTKN